MREGLIDIVQAQAYGPLHVRGVNPAPTLRVVSDTSAAAAAAAGEGKVAADEDLA
jgi:hypothetical protein